MGEKRKMEGHDSTNEKEKGKPGTKSDDSSNQSGVTAGSDSSSVKRTEDEQVDKPNCKSNHYLESYDDYFKACEAMKRSWQFRNYFVAPKFESPRLDYAKYIPEIPKLSEEYLNNLRSMQDQITELNNERLDLFSKMATIYTKPTRSKSDKKLIDEYESTIEQLKNKLSLADLLGKIHQQAAEKVLQDEQFRQSFFDVKSPAFVLAADIRRSTELMLKARSPKLFAEFISTLAAELRKAVIDNFGIFDKFTGDGVLAYFPVFYSGDDASLNCVAAAVECHRRFAAVYKAHRRCFVSVLKETGLGIGIDFGEVHFQHVAGELVIVGTPVVYACRMAAAPAGKTFLNQPAYEEIVGTHSDYVEMPETEIMIKNEGLSIAYDLQTKEDMAIRSVPSWYKETEKKEA